MSVAVVVSAPGKVNLTLDILGRRADGYHEIATVMQAVTLADTVTLTPDASGRLSLSIHGAPLPPDEKNTACVAARRFWEYVGAAESGLHIRLDKRVPMQAGMAGGSADAAGVLVGLNALTGAGLTCEELCAIGTRIGADVPFCVRGGTTLATGTGTEMTPLSPLPECTIVLVKPPVGVSTAAAYAAIDRAPQLRHPDNDAMRQALEGGQLSSVGRLMGNVFEQALALPEVKRLTTAIAAFSPLGCCMTGSGSVVFALFDDEAVAARCVAALRAHADAAAVFSCHPCRHGAQVIG